MVPLMNMGKYGGIGASLITSYMYLVLQYQLSVLSRLVVVRFSLNNDQQKMLNLKLLIPLDRRGP